MSVKLSDKIMCFLGIHQMQPVKYLTTKYKKKYTYVKYTQRCHCCGRHETVEVHWSAWNGRKSTIY